MDADLYNNTEPVDETSDGLESTAETSTLAGARTAKQVMGDMSGEKSTALDSTAETSTLEGARSVEEIMDQMKEEEKAKSKSATSSVKSKAKSEAEKWKSAGVNKKNTAEKTETLSDKASDVVGDVQDMSNKVTNFSRKSTQLANTATAVMSAFGITKAGEAVADKVSEKDESATKTNAASDSMQTSAPTDMAIAAYQKDVADAKANGAHVKHLPYTDAQQRQWNAQDQHRMYSNYGTMYEHGANEMEYNVALLNSAMASAGMGMPVKALSPEVSFRQKFLSSVEKDDNKMDINSLSFDKIMSGDIDLLKVDQKQSTEDLAEVNRDAHVADRYAAEDHDLDARDAEKADIAKSFAEASAENTKKFTESFFDRGATVDADLGLDKIAGAEKQNDFEADFF